MLDFKNEKELTTLDKLKKLYGFYEGNLRYIPRGGELLNCIGSSVVMIHYTKSPKGAWEYSIEEVNVISITNYDPMTVTYDLTYERTKGKSKSQQKVKIIPEGFSFENPEETGNSVRFIPLSMHFKFQEDKQFFERLFSKFDDAKTLSVNSLEDISNSKEQLDLLGRNYNIVAAIKTNEDTPEILYFRIDRLKIKHNKQDSYSLTIENLEKNKLYTFLIDSKAESYEFEYKNVKIGSLKILDLQKL